MVLWRALMGKQNGFFFSEDQVYITNIFWPVSIKGIIELGL